MHTASATSLPAVPGDPDDGPCGAVDAESGVAVFVPGDSIDVGEGVTGVSENAIRIYM